MPEDAPVNTGASPPGPCGSWSRVSESFTVGRRPIRADFILGDEDGANCRSGRTRGSGPGPG